MAVAEARTALDSDCAYKWLVFTRSTDNGTTWSPVSEVWGRNLTNNQGSGNPVLIFDNITGTLILHGSVNDPQHCSPTLYTFQVDDGGSDGLWWGHFMNLSSFLGPWNGATPGPGTGTQLGPNSRYPGRLIVPSHYGVYQDDVSWYSDDHGKSWTVSQPALPHLDEVVVTALPSGRVMLNARSDHYNASCQCRAVTTSEDGGATWETPVQWDSTLIEPVCQASLVTIGPLADYNGGTALFFSNPASTSARQDLTVRRSNDEGSTWLNSTYLVQGGPVWGGYSCIAPGAPLTRADGGKGGTQQYGAIIYERQVGNTVGIISFTLFPTDVAPRPRTFIPASHPSVYWAGRHVSLEPVGNGSVSFDFPGVTAMFNTTGSSYITAQFSSTCGNGPRLESSVDGADTLNTTSAGSFWLYPSFSMPHPVGLASGLDNSLPHTLTIRLASEARWANCSGPQGVTLDGVWTDGQPTQAYPSVPLHNGKTRKLEWVGDSITAGYGTAPVAGSNPCPSLLAVEDPSRAATFRVCAGLESECSVVAVSGDTVLTPPGGAPADKPPLPLVYPRARTYMPQLVWDVSRYVPDAIIINLGTNEQIMPNFNTSYIPALHAFLLQLSGPASVFAIQGLPIPLALTYCGPMVFDYCDGMQEATAAAAASGARVQFLGQVNATLDGCAGHPGPVGQAQMAQALQPRIAAALGW